MAGDAADRVTYDRVLLMDTNPGPNYPYVTVVSFNKVGIPVRLLENMKLTRELRLQPRQLPIYPDPGHVYYILAKFESAVDRTEELRAVSAVNEFVTEFLRAGTHLKDIPRQVVDNFKSRVQRLVPYVRLSERGEHRKITSRYRKRLPASSSDPDHTGAEAGGRRSLDLSQTRVMGTEPERMGGAIEQVKSVLPVHMDT